MSNKWITVPLADAWGVEAGSYPEFYAVIDYGEDDPAVFEWPDKILCERVAAILNKWEADREQD